MQSSTVLHTYKLKTFSNKQRQKLSYPLAACIDRESLKSGTIAGMLIVYRVHLCDRLFFYFIILHMHISSCMTGTNMYIHTSKIIYWFKHFIISFIINKPKSYIINSKCTLGLTYIIATLSYIYFYYNWHQLAPCLSDDLQPFHCGIFCK